MVSPYTISNDYSLFPGGKYIHKSCINSHSQCKFPPISLKQSTLNITNGWIAYTGFKTEDQQEMQQFISYFKVPALPLHRNPLTTVFLFPGLEPDERPFGYEILQPVLQLGVSGCGGSEFHWTYGSYYVPGMKAHCSKLFKVEQGDVLLSNMTRLNETHWNIESAQVDVKDISKKLQSVNLIAKPQRVMKWACLTLEVYRLYKCSEYPASNETVFFKNEISTVTSKQVLDTIPWKSNITHSDCPYKVIIDDEGKTVTLQY